MKYDFLLFDMDDTLFDFQTSEQEAFRRVMELNGIVFSEEVFTTYKKTNRQLWTRFEKGEIPKEMIFKSRFSDTVKQFGIDADGSLMEQQYREGLGMGAHLVKDAEEICQILGRDHQLYIVTNGVAKTQNSRLDKSGLRKYFQDVFISESIGAQKPSARYFDYVKAHIPGFQADRALIIGDSPGSDIEGGRRAGIDTCWRQVFDGSECPGGYTYKIKDLKELLDICK